MGLVVTKFALRLTRETFTFTHHVPLTAGSLKWPKGIQFVHSPRRDPEFRKDVLLPTNMRNTGPSQGILQN